MGNFTKTWDDYRGTNNEYVNPSIHSFDVIEVLEFLKNKPLDDIALNYMHAVRPSRIRVVEERGGITCDAVLWRVTVYVTKPESDDKDPVIKRVEQEVSVGCVGFEHGHALSCALRERP